MQAQTPPAPPPPAIVRREDVSKLLSTYPVVGEGDRKLLLMGLTLLGELAVLERAKASLDREGWSGSILKDHRGRTVLSVGTEHRSLQEAVVLSKRLQANEFGAVEVQPLIIPAPSEAKK